MFKDAVQLKKPSRPPDRAVDRACSPASTPGSRPRRRTTTSTSCTTPGSASTSIYRPDVLAFTINIAPVKVYDALDYKLYDWPGHGVDEDSGYQYNEAEYMKADEYDKLIADPSNYWQRFYLPRVIGAMEPWATLDPFTDLVEGPMVGPFFIPFGTPPVQDMLKKMMEAGNAALEWIQAHDEDGRRTPWPAFGVPGFAGGATKAPYDILGDTMRGTRGLMLDKFRQPDKVLEACERLVPLAIDWGVRPCDINKHPFVFIPLHKGADGFLSDEDFRTFYWPTLKKVLLGLIEEGIVPLCFAEGALQRPPRGHPRPGDPGRQDDLDVRRHQHAARPRSTSAATSASAATCRAPCSPPARSRTWTTTCASSWRTSPATAGSSSARASSSTPPCRSA